MRFSRYLDAQEFAKELGALHAYRSGLVGDGLLESLERTRLVIPRVRVRLPDEIARRLWLENHGHVKSLKLPLEPDGERWNAALEFGDSVYRWRNYNAYGLSVHPLDDPAPRFAEFIQYPANTEYEPWSNMRTDVSSDEYDELYDSRGIDSSCRPNKRTTSRLARNCRLDLLLGHREPALRRQARQM